MTRLKQATCGLALLLLVQSLLGAHAALMAIDLGSEYLKVCLVKPGRTPISVVVNEMSRRKSPALVGLVDNERVLGEEAYSLAIRYPNLIFSQLRNLLGRAAEDAEVKRLLQQNLLPYTVVDDPARRTAAIKVNDTASFLVEELLAGIFQNAKQITDAQAGEPVVDTVVTVPAWFGVAQRQALIDAASLAGLNVLALMNTHSAAALQYGIERDFSKKEQLVVLYDMGSGSTEAALVRYSTYGKAGSSKGLINQFEVLDVEWDHALGSNSLDLLLADHFAAEFKEKGGGDVKAFPKAMAKLRRQVRRTKEVLSANTGAPISVEELHGGRDFQSSIKRDEFEAMAGPFWDRAADVLVRLLKRNKLTGKDVDAVELLGGGSRVPKLQAVLTEALGGRHLDRHLDADEAVVLGAGLFAANLSSSFRLRKFGMTDVAAFGVTFESHDLFLPVIDAKAKAKDAAADKKGKDKKAKDKKAKAGDVEEVELLASAKSGHVLKNLLPAGKKLPIKRAVKYNNLTIDGFSFELRYNTTTVHGLPAGVTEPALASYTVSGIKTAIQRYNHSGVTSLRFEADYSGLLHFSSAECIVELEVVEDKVIEVPEVANTTAADEAAADDGKTKDDGKAADKGKQAAADEKKAAAKDADAAADKGKDADAKEAADGDAKADAADSAANATAADANATAVPKIVMIKKTIQVKRKKTFHVALNVTGPGPRHAPLSGEPLAAAQAHIAAWQSAEAVKAATAKAKNDLEAYIISTREKLETDEGMQQVTTEESRVAFTEQLTEAEDWLYGDGEAEGAPAFTARLAALKKVGDPMARRAAELDLRPQVLTAVKEQLGNADKLVAGWAEGKPWITEEETQGAADKIEAFRKWLQEQEDAQAGKALTEDPAFASTDIISKFEVLSKALKKVDSKRKPKPPPAAKNETATAEADAKAGDGEGAAKAEAGAQAEAEAGAEASAEAKAGAESSDGGKAAAAEEEEELPVHEEL